MKITRRSIVGFGYCNPVIKVVNKPDYWGTIKQVEAFKSQDLCLKLYEGEYNCAWFVKVKGKWYRELPEQFPSISNLTDTRPTYNYSGTKVISKFIYEYIDINVEEVK